MPYDIIIGRDKEDKERFGKRGLIFIGKGYVKMGNYTSLSNNLWLDIVRSHVILIAGKRGCLTGNTKVLTDKGYKQINEFDEKKDKVLSFNKDKREFEWENAELLKYLIKDEKLFRIEFENNKKLVLTKEHPLLLVRGKKLLTLLWRKADDLNKGDNILSIGKSIEDLILLKIKSIKKVKGIKEVYDLSVNKNHSFIANGIISHNSGKSYSIGVLAEELSKLPDEVKDNIAPLIFDTMGIFWTMKYQNDKDTEILEEWNQKAEALPINIWAPAGYFYEYEKRKIPVNNKFALAASELNIEDWLTVFNLEMIDSISVLIQKVISNLKGNYNLEDIIEKIKEDSEAGDTTKKSATALFEAAKSWKVFAEKNKQSTKISDLIVAGKTSVIDLSIYSSVSKFNVRALIIGLISKKLFNQRMLARKKEEIDEIYKGVGHVEKEKKEMPLVWLFLDEAHEFLPMSTKTPASNALIQLLREGRQPGISMVLATQQPGVIHRDVMTQSDIVLAHRLTNKNDIQALNEIMQTYFLETIQKEMRELPDLKGSGIILDDNSERLYPVRIKPRITWHGGEAPKAISEEKKDI